jgi:predicted nucleic acid-binding Zn ribbon protein
MSDPPVEACEVCGAAPVEKVLFPVAVHFKGSGFYSTDYGRGSRKSSKDGDGSSGDKGEKAEKKDSSTTPAADSGSSTKDTKSS